MRAVLDTNVLVSALLSPRGTPAQLLRSWLDGGFDLVVSAALLDELGRVLAYPKVSSRITERDGVAFLALLSQHAIMMDDAIDALITGGPAQPPTRITSRRASSMTGCGRHTSGRLGADGWD